ncbi:hypothetical protein Dsin_025768 [Dipteronia sinensis]|uniref:Peptidase C1A papain C-terminal domain-containing protein n=1 Tax=Dipteronia sinensis TaxID=43782 RepID=A0AAD9ZY10_9ROSI|nr:hypothetical protein Dsin_025768 [Dipteronia sinensis]
MASPPHLLFATIFLLLAAIFTQEAIASKPLSSLKLNSKILQDSIIKKVNENPKAGWEAARNPHFSNYTVGEFKYLLGVKPTPEKELLGIPVVTHDKSLKLPDSFDARTAWPKCSSIGRILDQGHCGSCWAFGAVESLSDRFCIHFGMNISLSVNDLLACCGFLCGNGCNGGIPIYAWRYFKHHGIVSEECDPYFDDIGCSHPGCEPGYPTPKCVRKCVNGNQLWRDSKHYSVSAYRIRSKPYDIMAEVFKNGPVEVAFTVYELLANQWNKGWGDDGYFKIKRGTNECGIEKEAVAGMPSTKNLVREVAGIDSFMDASL